MKTYSEIKAEIAKLETQAQAARKSEVAGVVAKIKAAIEAYGITAADLGFGRAAAKTVTKKNGSKKKNASTGVPKYRDPKTGKTWTGRGKPPTWIAGVKNRDAYLIGTQAAEARATSSKGSTGGAGKAKVTAKASGKKKSVPTKKGGVSRNTQPAPVTTPAVQIESGVASE